jgi:hypothetical protein
MRRFSVWSLNRAIPAAVDKNLRPTMQYEILRGVYPERSRRAQDDLGVHCLGGTIGNLKLSVFLVVLLNLAKMAIIRAAHALSIVTEQKIR